MLDRFLKETKFESFEDFMQHYEVCVPEHFNFAYDVVDAWAKEDADKRALLWTNEQGEERTFTFVDMKRYADRTTPSRLRAFLFSCFEPNLIKNACRL